MQAVVTFMIMFIVLYGSHWPHVATEQLEATDQLECGLSKFSVLQV